jgi:Mce-associated membrane protein
VTTAATRETDRTTAAAAADDAAPPRPGTRRRARETAREAARSARPDPAEEAPPAAPPGRSRRAGRPLPSAATVWKVLAVLGVLGTIGFGLAWRGAEGRAAGRDGLAPEVVEMRGAAREFAIALTNFDAATIDADFDRIVDSATGDFAEEADRFYDEEIRSQLRDAQATSRSEVRDLYVQSFDGDTGTAFAVVDQSVANNRSPQPVTDTLRIELGMARVDGGWKVRTVEVLDAPPDAQADMTGLADDPGPAATDQAPPATAPGG